MQNDQINTIYKISFILAFLSGLLMYSSNLEQMSKVYYPVYWVETKTSVHTGVLESEKDWKENLPKIIWKQSILEISESDLKKSIDVIVEKKSKIWNIQDVKSVSKINTLNYESTPKTKSLAPSKVAKGINIATTIQTPLKSNCNTDCKINTLIKVGITSNLANLIVSECTEWALDPRHCIIVASSIVINESGGWKSNACKTRFNCFWIWSGKVTYTSYQESVANWVSKYNRYWYKAQSAKFFYPDKWKISPSKYCYSEDSSDSDIGCPFWQKIAQNIWNKLEKLM